MNRGQNVGFFAIIIGFCLGVSPRAAAVDERLGVPHAQGVVKFEDASYDFGRVKRGTKVLAKFAFTNVGKGPLVVHGVHATCGCTASEIDPGKTYAPGESGVVEVAFDTTNFKGRVSKSVTVMTSEKTLPDRTLVVEGVIDSELNANPPFVDFGHVTSREGAKQFVTIKAEPGSKIEMGKLRFNKDILDVTYAPDGDAWKLSVALRPNVTTGFLKETIFVETTSPALKEMPILVRGDVVGSIKHEPSYLEFGAVGPSESSKRKVSLKGVSAFNIVNSRTELNINGSRIADVSPYIKIDNPAGEEVADRELAVELQNTSQIAGSVHGRLIFETTDAVQKEVVVDFYAFFR